MTDTGHAPNLGATQATTADPLWRAHGAMLLFCLLISTSFTVGALITDAVEPVAMMFARFVLAGLVMGAVVVCLRVPIRITPLDGLRYAFLGTLISVYFVAMFEALRWTTPVNTGAIFTLVPLIAAGFAYILMRQKVAPRQLAILGMAATGALWVLFGGSIEALARFQIGRGEAIFLVGALSYGFYTAANRWLHRGEPILTITFWSIIAGALVLFVAGFAVIRATDWTNLPVGVWLGLVHLAVMNTAASFFLVKYATTRLPAAKVTAYTYLLPVFVAFQQGALGLGWPSLSVLAGVAVIALAMVLLQRTPDA